MGKQEVVGKAAKAAGKVVKEAAEKGEGGKVGELIGAINLAIAVVEAANKLLGQAKPLLEDVDAVAVAGKAKVAANVAKDKAGGVVEAVAAAVGKAGANKDALLEAIRNSKNEKELAKIIKKTKQVTLESAPTKLTIAEFVKKTAAAAESLEVAAVNPFGYCGYYAIATYKKLDFDKDLTDYVGVFVGKGTDVGQSILWDISRKGNPDVYADVKYKQNVHVYIYNCQSEELEDKYESLCEVLQAQESYNAE